MPRMTHPKLGRTVPVPSERTARQYAKAGWVPESTAPTSGQAQPATANPPKTEAPATGGRTDRKEA